MKSSTQGVYRNIINRFCEETGKKGIKYGDFSAAKMQREHVIMLMAAKAHKPDAANGLRKALRAMMAHAVAIGIRSDDPTQGVKAIKRRSKTGFHRWNEAEIAQFEETAPDRNETASCAGAGPLHGASAARCGGDGAAARQVRSAALDTARRRKAPPHLICKSRCILICARPLMRLPVGTLTFLVTEFGKPFAVAGFGNWFRDQCDMANLHHCTFHGLRKAASVRLAEAGCTPHEIAAITGHASLKEIVRYTATADRKKLAASAIAKMKVEQSRTFSG